MEDVGSLPPEPAAARHSTVVRHGTQPGDSVADGTGPLARAARAAKAARRRPTHESNGNGETAVLDAPPAPPAPVDPVVLEGAPVLIPPIRTTPDEPATDAPTADEPTGVVVIPVSEPLAPPVESPALEPITASVPMRPLRAPVQVRRRRRPRVRRVTRVIRHVDTWSVFKVALVFNLFMYAVCLTAGVLLWQVAYATGTIDNVEKFFEGFGWTSFTFKGGEIYHNAWIGGLFVVVGLTGVAVLMATLFNLITDLVGGIRVSVLEEEVIPRSDRFVPAPYDAAKDPDPTGPVAAPVVAPQPSLTPPPPPLVLPADTPIEDLIDPPVEAAVGDGLPVE